MPSIFSGLSIPFSDEIERGDQTYLVRIQPSQAGILYIAKNITHFEDRAAWFQIALGLVILAIVALSLLLTILVSRRIRSEEHTSELKSLMRISYAVFCLKKQIKHKHTDSQLDNKHMIEK